MDLINHADRGNVEFIPEKDVLVAIEDIPAGSEICSNYRPDWWNTDERFKLMFNLDVKADNLQCEP